MREFRPFLVNGGMVIYIRLKPHDIVSGLSQSGFNPYRFNKPVEVEVDWPIRLEPRSRLKLTQVSSGWALLAITSFFPCDYKRNTVFNNSYIATHMYAFLFMRWALFIIVLTLQQSFQNEVCEYSNEAICYSIYNYYDYFNHTQHLLASYVTTSEEPAFRIISSASCMNYVDFVPRRN